MRQRFTISAKLGFLGYWLLQAVNTIRVSKFPGYYPPSVRAQAFAEAASKAYPWAEIAYASIVLALLTTGLYLTWRLARWKLLSLTGYVLAVLIVSAVLIPTDVGGVYGAYYEYILSTFLCVFVYGIYCFINYVRSRNATAP